MAAPITIEYFTDVLCVWAYGAQIRMDELKHQYGDQVRLHYRFIPLFAAAHDRVNSAWSEKGGFKGFSDHLTEVVSHWDHVSYAPDAWSKVRPFSSTQAHLFAAAVRLLMEQGKISAEPREDFNHRSLLEEFVWQLRAAFFSDARDVGERAVILDIAKNLDLPVELIVKTVERGEAFAELHLDMQAQEQYQVPGSPTLIFNEGRQRLYGNVGYRIIEANIREYLENQHYGQASWC